MYHNLTERLVVPERRRLDRLSMHALILEAVKARDVDTAIDAFHAHLGEIKERIATI